MIRTLKEALSFVRIHRIVPMTPAGDLPSFVTEVVGERVKGSWWGHPKGNLVYDLAEGLLDSEEVCSIPLIDGRSTLVHSSLLPALYRVVTDAGWRRSKTDELAAVERKLLAAVEKAGTLVPDPWAKKSGVDGSALKKARERLAKELLLKSASVHTESGKHVAVLHNWKRWAKEEIRKASRGLSLVESREMLSGLCRGHAPAI